MSNTPDQPSGPTPHRSEGARDVPPSPAPVPTPVPESGSAQPTTERQAGRQGGGAGQVDDQQSARQETSSQTNNQAKDVSGGNIVQGGRDVHFHQGLSASDYVKLREIEYELGGGWRRRKAHATKVSTIQATQQPTPKDKEEYAQQFDNLSNEDKLFVTLLRLLPDITWVNFWKIYDAAAAAVLPKPPTPKKNNADDDDDEPEAVLATPPRFRSETYWVNVAHAVVKQTDEINTEGRFSQTTINFASEDVCEIIAGSLSAYQRQWLFRLIPVLYELGHNSYLVIRRMVAQAAAILADIDWNEIRYQIIEPWSQDDDIYTRASVAYILDAVLANGKNDGYVIALLCSWSNPSERVHWRQCWTAVIAFKLIGLRRFEFARDSLLELGNLADKTLDKYCEDPNKLNDINVSKMSQFDKDLIVNLPESVISTLVYLMVEGKVYEIIGMFQRWLAEPVKRANYIYRNKIVLGSLYGVSLETFNLKCENVDIQSDVFELLQQDKKFRKNLAGILACLTRYGPEHRSAIRELLEHWLILFADLGLSTEPVGRVMINIFRRLDTTNRERFLQALRRMSQHKHATVRTRSTDVLHHLQTVNYPPAVPETPGSNEGELQNRIIFGKP